MIGFELVVISAGTDATLLVSGELDETTARGVGRELMLQAENGARTVTIDLQGVHFIDAAAVSMLVDERTRLRQMGTELVLASPGPGVTKVLEMGGLPVVPAPTGLPGADPDAHLRPAMTRRDVPASLKAVESRNYRSARMTTYTIGRAAELLGVSPDTVRRWADSGKLPATRTPGGRRIIDGQALASFASTMASAPESVPIVSQSARNRFTGIITKVTKDHVMAQVEMQAGPFRIVSLMSREAADELHLAPGVMAVASVKSTNVTIELPAEESQ